eukprot:3939786-Rhodomonas_salina.4
MPPFSNHRPVGANEVRHLQRAGAISACGSWNARLAIYAPIVLANAVAFAIAYAGIDRGLTVQSKGR